MVTEAAQSSVKTSDPSAAESPRSGIVWLASYPKSGNTWTRAFLHNLVHVTSGQTQAQQINELNQFSMTSAAKSFFEEALGFCPTVKHLDQIAAARARVQQHLADLVEGLIFVKTHQALGDDRGHLNINFSVTAGAIYIIRNPLDVAISYAHHLARPIDATIDLMNLKNAETSVSEKQVYELYGSLEPARLELDAQAASGDLRHALRGHARRAAEDVRRIGAAPLVQADWRRARRCDQRSSFEQLKEQEEKDGFRERPDKAERLFRDGRAGQWKEILTPAQIKRIVDAHGEQMARFGYLPK